MAVRREEARLRKAAARRQGLRCHYCGARMWLTDARAFVARHGVSAEQAARFQCTAEHLQPRHADGANAKHNVVAACRACNLGRHALDPAPDAGAWADQVRERLRRGDWHPAWAFERGIVDAIGDERTARPGVEGP